MPDEGIETLFGPYDENLRHLESALGVSLKTRGHDVVIEGGTDEVGRAEQALEQLAGLLREGYRFARGDVQTAAQLLSTDPSVELREFFRKSSALPAGRRQVTPKSLTQRRYLELIEGFDIVFGIGPAGTGKTYLAMAMAVSALVSRAKKRIILARPAVEAGEKLGFLPGDLLEKVHPYLRPLYDALYDMLEAEQVARHIAKGTIEVAPIAFMRGRTLNDSFVILDEAQNTTSEQMKMFLTRLGFNSKAVITGDITQIDLPPGKVSGLREAQGVLSGIEGLDFVYFTDRDVVRHPLVQSIIKAYERHTLAMKTVDGG